MSTRPAPPGRASSARSWAVVSSSVAVLAPPIAWTVAQTHQPPRYSAARETISALAAQGATDRWIMTTGLILLGLAHLGTALALVDIGRVPRMLLALAGLSTLAVAALPQPAAGHSLAAGIAFVALGSWPVLSPVPSRTCRLAAAVVLFAVLLWFASQLQEGSSLLGLSERVVVVAEALWPLVVAVGVRARSTRLR